jgi:uncharacterized protein
LSYDLELDEIGLTEHEVAENPLFEVLEPPVRVELVVTRSGRRFLVRGRVVFRAMLECAVCLKEFEREYVERLAAEYVAEGDVPSIQGKLMDTDEREPVRFDAEALDLGSLVRDTVHLAVPIAPKCHPDCKGLCPVCGNDLNQGECDCPCEQTSPLAGLEKLKDDAAEPPSG